MFPFASGNDTRLFREEGVSNYTVMLLQEDTKLLLLGAREALFALDLEDISKKQASVRPPPPCNLTIIQFENLPHTSSMIYEFMALGHSSKALGGSSCSV